VGGCALIVGIVEDTFDRAAGAVEGGLADAGADTVLVGDGAGSDLKLTRPFAFFGKFGLLPS